MRRREFILGAAGLAGVSAATFWSEQRIVAQASYPGRAEGHALRDAQAWPEASQTLEADVLIAGSGIAGLSAAWQLARSGVRDILVISGPELHGNAAGASSGALHYPTGAHYLPLPALESRHVREMLAEFGVIKADPFGERPVFDERYVVHAPAERILFRSSWQDGLLPDDGVAGGERAEHARFFALTEALTSARGADGRRGFVVPIELSSSDARFRSLDAITFKAWLDDQGFASPTLHWYLDYCCRDDYGRHYTEISAWAGLLYFCGRNGLAKNAERGAVLTWPQGLAALADALEGAAAAATTTHHATVARLSVTEAGVEALCFEQGASGMRTFRVKARAAIAAMPLFVLAHVLDSPERFGFDARRDVPAYAPWLVSNFLLGAFPLEKTGAPLSWDNVVFEEPGLGYVVSTHQDIRMSRPERTAFTAYNALSDLEPIAARRWLDAASVDELLGAASRDLKLAYGWKLAPCVERVEITVRGHAMAIPAPGFLSVPGRLALRAAPGPLFFAHADLSGLSVFEEAAWWGYRAAQSLIAARR
jgi:glycine/D-amino acid oxidase-like deaminating enzyme